MKTLCSTECNRSSFRIFYKIGRVSSLPGVLWPGSMITTEGTISLKGCDLNEMEAGVGIEPAYTALQSVRKTNQEDSS